ncbi:MAG: hypothetical protein K9H49_01925 [Bacteroidales bacterium]|nr:hypothetical protein [Bacteroidales bacterium]MCF8403326.1 hypothetical protein [Bacteroidales bacterium]
MIFSDSSGTLVFLIIVAAILLVLFIANRARLHLFFTKLFYGTNSNNYFRNLNRYFGELPYPDAIKFDPIYFMKSFYKKSDQPYFQSEKEILFNEIDLGTNYPGFLKKMGSPSYVTIRRKKEEGVEVFVYGFKRKVYEYDAAILYFFSGDLFLMGQYIFKREKQEISPDDINQKLKSKYLSEENNSQTKYTIKGSNKTLIDFEDNGFAVTMSYFNPDKSAVRKMVFHNTAWDSGVKDSDTSGENESLTF